MAIANVALTNTFDEWRTITNQLAYQSNIIEVTANNLYISSNSTNVNVSSAFAKANAVANGANAFTVSTIAGANVAVGLGANSYANVVWARANSRMDTGGIEANTFATVASQSSNLFFQRTIAGANAAVGLGANSYADAAEADARAYANLVWARSNTRIDTATVAANSYANLVWSRSNTRTDIATQAANNNAANATYMTTGTVASARMSGSYTGITGVGTVTTGTWQATTLDVAYGGTGASTLLAARTNLGIGNNAIGERYVQGTQPASAVNGDIWYKV